ncbi:MAG: BtpA/SgcQ family protein [Rhodopirellula sp.]|nr:BtpA/SgcQ family protein [Rhodopirellula sp.]
MPHPVLNAAGPTLIGMLHVPPLPGSPHATKSFSAIRDHVVQDAESLLEGGVSNLMIENFGDTPFFPGEVPAHTVAHLTAIATEISSRFPEAELGLNVLRNDGCSALAIAAATGASFIRVNVLCGARVTDQGIVQGIAHDLLRLRKTLSAENVAILADVDVKHSAPLARRPIADEIEDVIKRGHADAIIVSGNATGAAIDPAVLREAASAAGSTPILIGSGATASAIESLAGQASGFIVGTAFKRNGNVHEPVDRERVLEFVTVLRSA